MNTKFSSTTPEMVHERVTYVADLDGAHVRKGIGVGFELHGVRSTAEFELEAKAIMSPQKRRGAPLQYPCWELSAHPYDGSDARRSFGSLEEMSFWSRCVRREFKIQKAIVGYHGRSDIHVLALNRGAGGNLKETLAGRSNPRRVLVAVSDRAESVINRLRKWKAERLLLTVEEFRKKRRGTVLPFTVRLANAFGAAVAVTGPSINDILWGWGWQAELKKKKIRIWRAPEDIGRDYDLDLLVRSIAKRVVDRERAIALEEARERKIKALRADEALRTLDRERNDSDSIDLGSMEFFP